MNTPSLEEKFRKLHEEHQHMQDVLRQIRSIVGAAKGESTVDAVQRVHGSTFSPRQRANNQERIAAHKEAAELVLEANLRHREAVAKYSRLKGVLRKALPQHFASVMAMANLKDEGC